MPLTTSGIGRRLARAEIMNVFRIPGLTLFFSFADLELQTHPQRRHQPADRAHLRAGGLAMPRDLHPVRFAGILSHETK
jgi:hypothetical protein